MPRAEILYGASDGRGPSARVFWVESEDEPAPAQEPSPQQAAGNDLTGEAAKAARAKEALARLRAAVAADLAEQALRTAERKAAAREAARAEAARRLRERRARLSAMRRAQAPPPPRGHGEREADRILRATSPYDVLGVPPDAPPSHVRNRYRLLARRYDASRNAIHRAPSEQKRLDMLMARINDAYDAVRRLAQ